MVRMLAHKIREKQETNRMSDLQVSGKNFYLHSPDTLQQYIRSLSADYNLESVERVDLIRTFLKTKMSKLIIWVLSVVSAVIWVLFFILSHSIAPYAEAEVFLILTVFLLFLVLPAIVAYRKSRETAACFEQWDGRPVLWVQELSKNEQNSQYDLQKKIRSTFSYMRYIDRHMDENEKIFPYGCVFIEDSNKKKIEMIFLTQKAREDFVKLFF